MIDVWIIEDNDEFRKIVRIAIGRTNNIRCSQAFSSCEEALDHLSRSEPPQIILLDICLPGLNGVEGLKRFKARAASAHVIMLTMFDEDSWIVDAMKAGAAGYLLKTDGIVAILEWIQRAAHGEPLMSPPVARSVLNYLSRYVSAEPSGRLSSREKEILGCFREGSSKDGTAAKLQLPAIAVDDHIRSILAKFRGDKLSEVSSRAVHP